MHTSSIEPSNQPIPRFPVKHSHTAPKRPTASITPERRHAPASLALWYINRLNRFQHSLLTKIAAGSNPATRGSRLKASAPLAATLYDKRLVGSPSRAL